MVHYTAAVYSSFRNNNKRGVLDLIEIAEVGFPYMLICIKCMDAKGTLSMDLHYFQTYLSLDILTTESIDVINNVELCPWIASGILSRVTSLHGYYSPVTFYGKHPHSHAVCCLLYNYLG